MGEMLKGEEGIKTLLPSLKDTVGKTKGKSKMTLLKVVEAEANHRLPLWP